MSNNSPEKIILGEGIISGFFFGAAYKTGINADPESILITILTAFENAFEPLLPPNINFHQTVELVLLAIGILGILSFIITIASCGDIIKGLIIFSIGFVMMLVLIILFVQ